MIEEKGHCPLCAHEFGNEQLDDPACPACPNCEIGLFKHVPLIRITRTWYWEFTDNAIRQLRELWLAREK